MNDPVLIASLALTAFCALAAIAVALVPVFIPAANESTLIPPLFRMLLFVFSIGAGAVLFKALG